MLQGHQEAAFWVCFVPFDGSGGAPRLCRFGGCRSLRDVEFGTPGGELAGARPLCLPVPLFEEG